MATWSAWGVEPVGVEGDHHLRPQPGDDRQELPLQGNRILVHQRPGVAAPHLDGKPGIAVAEPDRRGDPHDRAGVFQLFGPQPSPLLPLGVAVRVDLRVNDLPLLTAGGADKVDVAPLGGCLPQGPPADERLVVRVGEHGQQAHLIIPSPLLPSTSMRPQRPSGEARLLLLLRASFCYFLTTFPAQIPAVLPGTNILHQQPAPFHSREEFL